jgi:maltose alpha-D-glucosyltransferase/alpha-amylase
VRPLAQAVLDARQSLHEYVEACVLAGGIGAKSRYHGDLHLGQLLVVENDTVIADFEGEPARPLSERRRKHSPLKDVAGMLRSFAYAGAAATLHQVQTQPNMQTEIERFIEQWEAQAVSQFLAAYWETIAGAPTGPQDAHSAQQLLMLFVLEKALYELRYEQAHRPGWIAIPLRALAKLAREHEALTA